MNKGKRTPVLGDHRRVQSKLVTPFNDRFGPGREVSWINVMIPEMLWIALVQRAWGPRRGVEIITAFTRDVRASDPTRNRTIWAAAGKFSALPVGVLTRIVEDQPYKDDLCASLAPLNVHYPDHPMRELISPTEGGLFSKQIDSLKSLVAEQFDRSSPRATMVQATATWLAFDADRLKVSKGQALAHFPRIEDYPNTKQSKMIAASVRATLNGMFGNSDQMASGSNWPNAFWNRGLELEPCED